ncbi:APC family permease [Natribacillus halophilus]|uniref:Putrescine:proton symporter, AAT family n=1 Tax=Natribacillus halophilus TaxID=549003 RepID=A0A1G8JWI3_9BACI|nr:APC family permease [Natribacillus halophilus]SDI35521.1 putrescine:proton symporter, AAT family [Natribacillus halophilus]
MNSQGQLQRSLKLWHVVSIGIAYMAPFAVFDTFGIVTEITTGHVPTAYILVFAAILFTAFSYSKMVRLYPIAGSVYTYTQRTMNSHLGFIVGWSTFMAYLALPMINALLARVYLSPAFPDVPTWVWPVLTIIVITVFTSIGLKISASMNGLLVVYQFLIGFMFIILTIISITNVQPDRLMSIDPILSSNIEISALFAGAAILALSFIGFDAITMLSEETIEPKKTIPKGIFLVVFIGFTFFFTVTYFMQSLFPSVSQFDDIESASPLIAQFIGGDLFLTVFVSGALASVLSAGVAAQMSASRLLYAMGRDGVLPKKFFGYVHPKFKTPIFNIVLIGVISLSSLLIDLETAASLINFGAFTAFTFVNLCVIVHYLRTREKGSSKSIFSYIISPLIGMGFVLYLWVSLELFTLYVGIIWVLIGFGYLLYVTNMFNKQPPHIDFDELEG